MDILSLILASSLLLIPIYISYREHLELEKELIISIVRAIIQLLSLIHI